MAMAMTPSLKASSRPRPRCPPMSMPAERSASSLIPRGYGGSRAGRCEARQIVGAGARVAVRLDDLHAVAAQQRDELVDVVTQVVEDGPAHGVGVDLDGLARLATL